MIKNLNLLHNFINTEDRLNIINYVNSLHLDSVLTNQHLKSVFNQLNGSSYMFDISNTVESNYVTQYQSDNNLCLGLPDFLINLGNQISNVINIPHKNCFLQIIDMNKGGRIVPHYDSTFPNHINYKCNLSILSNDYIFCIDNNEFKISQGDLYSFESSLYKHWTKESFNSRRILLSYGFVLPYADLGWNENDPRIRMGKRIEKYFQSNYKKKIHTL